MFEVFSIFLIFDLFSISQLLNQYCPDADSSYYGSLLVFTGVSFGMISAYVALVGKYENAMQSTIRYANKKTNDERNLFSGEEKISIIVIYAEKHPGRFLLSALFFWLGAFFTVLYMFFKVLVLGKISFIFIIVASFIILLIMIYLAFLFLKNAYVRYFRLKFLKMLKKKIDGLESKIDEQIKKED